MYQNEYFTYLIYLLTVGLFGTRTYENPSPHPVGSAGPVNCSKHFPRIACIYARVVFQGATFTSSSSLS